MKPRLRHSLNEVADACQTVNHVVLSSILCYSVSLVGGLGHHLADVDKAPYAREEKRLLTWVLSGVFRDAVSGRSGEYYQLVFQQEDALQWE